MPDQWKLDVASRQAMSLWDGEARRVHAVLTAISIAFRQQYGQELNWQSETLDFAQWQDTSAIAKELIRERLRDDFGNILVGASASLVTCGFLGAQQTPHPPVLARMAAGDVEWPFNLNLDIEADEPESGARPLPNHPTQWLVDLLCTTAAAAEASEGRIRTFRLSRLLHREREDALVGALTLLPQGADAASLPADVDAYPCTTGYPNGTVVVVTDLTRVETDPASLVDSLLRVDDILRQSAGTA